MQTKPASRMRGKGVVAQVTIARLDDGPPLEIDNAGAQGVDRSVVRVLDALLWGSHKASWVAPLAP